MSVAALEMDWKRAFSIPGFVFGRFLSLSHCHKVGMKFSCKIFNATKMKQGNLGGEMRNNEWEVKLKRITVFRSIRLMSTTTYYKQSHHFFGFSFILKDSTTKKKCPILRVSIKQSDPLLTLTNDFTPKALSVSNRTESMMNMVIGDFISCLLSRTDEAGFSAFTLAPCLWNFEHA